MLERILMTGFAYLIITAVSVWIAYKCWQDSKDDLKMVYRDFINLFAKKKKADRGGASDLNRHNENYLTVIIGYSDDIVNKELADE